MLLFIAGCVTDQDKYSRLLLRDNGNVESGISITWMGTAGVLISDGDDKILIDPFVSRTGMDFFSIALEHNIRSDMASVRRWVESLEAYDTDAIFISHTHYDHSIDAASFHSLTAAPIYGSRSTVTLFSDVVQPENLIQVEVSKKCKIGDFTVSFLPGRHGKHFLIGVKYLGSVDRPIIGPVPPSAYREGENYIILIEHPFGKILHIGSSGWVPGRLNDEKADVVLMAASNGSDNKEYILNTAGKVGAELMIPIHFDNLFDRLDGNMRFQPLLNLSKFTSTAEEVLDDVSIHTLPIGERVMVLPQKSPDAMPQNLPDCRRSPSVARS